MTIFFGIRLLRFLAFVPATFFSQISSAFLREQLFQRLIKHLQESTDKWQNQIAKILIAHQGKKDICVTFASSGRKVMAHIVCHQDSKLIKLAGELKEFPFSFPRGFGILFNKDRITGVAPFYPKFDNDKEKTSKEVVDGKYNEGSFFVKYSGSLAKVLIWEDETRAICWTVMSKNSADSTSASGDSGLNYPRALAAVIAPYMSQERLQAIHASGVRSFCAEVMLACDNSHGYRAIDGFIVTCAAAETHFLGSKELTKWCEEFGFPTDRPLHIEGTEKILAFVQELNKVRDIMTVDVLQAIITEFGLEYDLSKHRHIVQSLILEGFIITLHNAKGEKLVLKYKFAFYTAVTMFLREYIKTTRKGHSFVIETKIAEFLKNWVFDKSVEMQSLWCWILHEMVRVADTQTFEGPVGSWIQVSELVYARVFEALATNGNDVTKVCGLLKCPEVRFVDPKSRPKGTIIVIVGYFGSSKSTLGNLIAEQIEGVHFDCDGCKKGVWMETSSVLKLSSNRNMVTVAEILKLVSQGHRVVVSSGGGNIPNLKEKAAQLGFDLDIIVMAPKNLHLYDDKLHIETLIKYRASLPGSTWDVKKIDDYFASSQKNKVYAKKFITEAKSSSSPLFEYPQMRTPEDAAKFVSQTADKLKALMQTTLTIQKVKCQRQQQNVVFDKDFAPAKFDRATTLGMQMYDTTVEDKLKGKLPQFMKGNGFAGTPAHITLMFNEKLAELAIMSPLIPVGESREVTVSFCVAEVPEGIMSGTTLAPFVVVFIGEKSYHITLDSGPFTNGSMKNVTQAYLSGNDTAVFEIDPSKVKQNTPLKIQSQTLTCNFCVVATQKTTITGCNVIALN
jgi:hypothetical protein